VNIPLIYLRLEIPIDPGPPLSVMLVAGPGMDCIINTLCFIAGVIPGHIHGFYITCAYFHRKRKVRKGRYPGGRTAGIWSQQVWNGGASNRHVRELWEDGQEEKKRKEDEFMLKRSSRSSKSSRSKSMRY
jgi:uncharacterized membrane protein YqaE (UPF0057 family)